MIPLFKSHFSIGKSILRIDDILSLTEGLEQVYFVEDNMTGFPEVFRKFGERLRFGLRFSIYNEDHNQESESRMIAFANGDAGAKELYNLYTKQSDTKITKPWDDTKELQYVVPFYDSFLHKNLTTFSNCVVDLPQDVSFIVEDNNLPFDSLIENKIISYCKNRNNEIVGAKSIYYENREDVLAFQTYKLICNRRIGRTYDLSNPGLDHFGSDEFCFESWKNYSDTILNSAT
jgi:hypothetical protein